MSLSTGIHRYYSLFVLLVGMVLFCPGAGAEEKLKSAVDPADSPRSEAKRREAGSENPGSPRGHGRDHRDQWDSLSAEERENLRAVLRDVWTDPDVVSAREDVKRASESYQETMREAVRKANPSLAKLLGKLQSSSSESQTERAGGEGGGGGPKGRPGIRRGDEFPLGPPGFLDRLSEEERARFKKAEAEAQKSEAVESVRRRLSELQKEGEELRRRRIEAFRDLRKTLFETMIETDPGLRERIEEMGASRGTDDRARLRRPGGE